MPEKLGENFLSDNIEQILSLSQLVQSHLNMQIRFVQTINMNN